MYNESFPAFSISLTNSSFVATSTEPERCITYFKEKQLWHTRTVHLVVSSYLRDSKLLRHCTKHILGISSVRCMEYPIFHLAKASARCVVSVVQEVPASPPPSVFRQSRSSCTLSHIRLTLAWSPNELFLLITPLLVTEYQTTIQSVWQ
jgi:hypothetical protein